MAVPTRRLLTLSVLLAAVAGLGACDRAAKPGAPAAAPAGGFRGIDITGADYAQQLELPDADGKVRTLADFKGQVLMVFFGFTQCPDVCPTTMSELAEAKKKLGPDGRRVRGIFVTVDPQRDTPELLKAYLAAFDPDFVGLRGTPEQTQAAAKHFKVFYAKVPGKTETSYGIDHTAGGYLFDAKGKVRVFTRHASGPDALAEDLKRLLAEG